MCSEGAVEADSYKHGIPLGTRSRECAYTSLHRDGLRSFAASQPSWCNPRLGSRMGRRFWWITTRAFPSWNRTGGFPASGSRRLFAGLLHERAYAGCCDDLPCSWLAGIGSAAGSELPLPFSGTVGVTIPFGPSPRSLSALDSSAQLPLLRSTPLSGASRLL